MDIAIYPGGKVVLQTWSVVKGCAPEMISRTITDHNLGGQPGQLATGKLQGGFKQIPPQSLKRQIRIGQKRQKKPIT